MTKQDKQLTEEEILRLIKEYQSVLLLDRLIFKVHYGLEKDTSLAESAFHYPYLDATIRYGDELVNKVKNKQDITHIILHEMCHSITDPLYSKAMQRLVSRDEIEDERERLTDHIANIIELSLIKVTKNKHMPGKQKMGYKMKEQEKKEMRKEMKPVAKRPAKKK